MTHITLLRNGWRVIFTGNSFTAYQLCDKIAVIWDSGKSVVYDV